MRKSNVHILQCIPSTYEEHLLLEDGKYENSTYFNTELRKKLKQQQEESEEDSKWLSESEIHLKRLSVNQEQDVIDNGLINRPISYLNFDDCERNSGSLHVNKENELHSSTDSVSSQLHTSIGNIPTNQCEDKDNISQCESLVSETDKKDLSQNPTANLDRTHDRVYECTTDVVRAVMTLSQGVQQAAADDYLDLVKKVGIELRSLLSSVDNIVSFFPTIVQREVEMAHKVLSKDMAELVNAMKLAQQYSSTTLDAEYRKGMLGAAHILAMDSKNLLDVVDSIRMRHPQISSQIFKPEDSLSDGEKITIIEDEEKSDSLQLYSTSPTSTPVSGVYTDNQSTSCSSLNDKILNN